jgi:hypothetical protein
VFTSKSLGGSSSNNKLPPSLSIILQMNARFRSALRLSFLISTVKVKSSNVTTGIYLSVSERYPFSPPARSFRKRFFIGSRLLCSWST